MPLERVLSLPSLSRLFQAPGKERDLAARGSLIPQHSLATNQLTHSLTHPPNNHPPTTHSWYKRCKCSPFQLHQQSPPVLELCYQSPETKSNQLLISGGFQVKICYSFFFCFMCVRTQIFAYVYVCCVGVCVLVCACACVCV